VGAPVNNKTSRRRLPGVTLRPGSVKQARHEAGLSLAQVGKGHVTAPAIYLIETGRTRPSLPTLEHIARRTGKPVEFFLADPTGTSDDGQAAVGELEAMVADGRYDEAIELGKSLLNLGTSAHRLGRIRYFLAMAYLQMGQPDNARGLLAEARAHFEALNDRVMLVECLGAEASMASLTQQPDAIARAELALAECRRLVPVPQITEARFLSILAGAFTANQQWDKAIVCYEQSIEAAGSLFDLRRLAKMYSGLSLSYHELGQLDTAARYATRSVALLEVLRDRVSLARSENNLALIFLARGDLQAARQHLDRSVELAHETDLQVGRSNILLSLCELCLQEGNVQQASEFAQEALLLAERLAENPNVAEAHMWLGRVAARLGDDDRADREFALSIGALEQLGAHERLLRVHGVYAEILEKRGDVARAYVHMKQALHASRPGLLKSPDGDKERASTA
jgi:tetratricopeptide (TPR) repeat protein/DNA-binding XRE family transcriptional regulator